MTQCVRDGRIVCFDRMRRKMTTRRPWSRVRCSAGVDSDYSPSSRQRRRISWRAARAPSQPHGARHYRHLEAIPEHERQWSVNVRGAAALGASLREHRDDAYLYRRLATLRTDAPLTETLDDLRWQGARLRELKDLCLELGNDDIIGRVPLWRDDP